MKCIYERPLTILPSMCDSAGKLGVPNAFALFMDAATEHADLLGIGMKDLAPRGLFWLTVRVKARFIRRPGLMETVKIVTWPEAPERSRCNRDYVIEAGGQALVEGRTEWMVMNMKTGRLQPTDAVFPQDLDIVEKTVLPEPFMRLNEDFSDAEAFGAYVVRSTDIDLGGHMNNAAYIRALAGAFSTAEWQALDVHGLEASYRAPCFEGDALELRRRQTPDGLEAAFLRGGKAAFLARLS